MLGPVIRVRAEWRRPVEGQLRRFTIWTSLLLATPAGSYAQGWGAIDLSIPMANTSYIIGQQIVTMTAPHPKYAPDEQTADDQDQADPVAEQAIMVARVDPARALAPTVLAQNYPAGKREQAEHVFRDMLAAHGSVMARFGLADNDLSGAVAAFVAGSYMAYHNVDFPDAYFEPLVTQMRETLENNTVLPSSTPAERRDAFEQLAILGMMSATTQMALKAEPGQAAAARIEANMRAAGERNLRQFLGVDPARVRLGANGVIF